MSEPFRVVSWGCGVQSTTLVELSLAGEVEPLDAVLTSDLGFERQRTYEVRDWYAERWRGLGLYVEVIQAGDIRVLGAQKHVHIPFWTSNGGPLRRQCTREFKVRPVRRRIRELLGYLASKPPAPPADAVEQWIGFSLDEWVRVNRSDVAFIKNRFPLIELHMTRSDCEEWLADRGLPVPIKSACVVCPYRSASEWLEMRDDAPEEFQEALEFDEENRANPLAAVEGSGSTADYLYIWKDWRTQVAGPLGEADLEAAAEAERDKVVQLPMMCLEGVCHV